MSKSQSFTVKLIFFASLIILAQNTFAQKSVDFRSEKFKNDTLNVAFVPFFDKEIDEQFIYSINQSPFKITDTTKVFKNLKIEFLKNTWFKNFVDGLEQNLQSEKNLFFGVNENDIKDFKSNILNSDVIYLHSEINSKTVTKINNSGNITLTCSIAVYDLQTGNLIVNCKVKSKTKFKDTLPDKKETIKKLSQDLFACFEQKLK